MTRVFITALSLFLSASLYATPAVWQASKGDMTVRIIGSIHVGDPSMYPLPSQITQFLNQSEGLIVEVDLAQASGLGLPATKVTTKQALNQAQQTQLDTIASDLKLPSDILLQSPPWLAAVTLEMALAAQAGYTPEYGVDQHLMAQASQKRVPLLPLETVQFQMSLLSDAKDQGKALLVSYLDQYRNSRANLACMFQSWQAGDSNNLAQFADGPGMPEALHQRLLTERNQNWAEQLDQWSRNKPGDYTMVVGALHLVGDKNVLSLLEQRGFTVERVTKPQSARCQFKY